MWTIEPLHGADNKRRRGIQAVIDNKTKPRGSLGVLEPLALQLALILGDKPMIRRPTMLVFAGDHGVAAVGVSIAPSEVTAQMVANFASGGAAINVFCRQVGMALDVVDCGILIPPAPAFGVIDQRLGAGTAPLHQGPAMSPAQVERGLTLARRLVQRRVAEGVNCFGVGEMGIGNTTAAAAVMAALTGHGVERCVGRGTGIDDQSFVRKREIVAKALALHSECHGDPLAVLTCVGGFEIVQMTGAILAIAEAGKVALIDGFIATVAALVAVRLNPHCRDYLVFGHCSEELGHRLLLDELAAMPLLQLGLRLGEGSGAALALPLLRSAAAFYNEMASFAEAGVTEV